MINNDENQFKEVTNVLKQLPKVNSPANFQNDLMRRINSGRYETEEKNFLEKFLVPSKLIPSAALAIFAVILLFVLNTSSGQYENPFSLQPRVRHDNVSPENLQTQASKETPALSSDKTVNSAQASFVSYPINKSGLNFMQVNLTEKERAKLNELKQKIEQYLQHSRAVQNKIKK